MTMSPSSTHVIVGASAAGMSAATAIRETDKDARVIVLTDEKDIPYFRPMIPYIISGKKTESEVTLPGKGPYRAEGIDIRTGVRVTGVSFGGKTVATSSGETIAYDRILVATGSSPYLPPEIKGLDTEGVYALRTLAQARHAGERCGWAKRAVMLGGGILNLKAAFALLERNIAVTLVVHSPEILSQLMEPGDARLVRDALENAGLSILTGRSATAVLGGNKGVSGVALNDGTELPCDMVFVGKGVRPSTSFLEGSGLSAGNGVPVDRFTRTEVEDVFAAGDAAVTFDPSTGKSVVTGLWTNAAEMGRCAGKNMAGTKSAYAGTFGVMNATQVANLPFVSMGVVHPDESIHEVHTETGNNRFLKLVFSGDGRRLAGLVMIGRIEGAGLYRYLIRENRDISAIKTKILAQTLHTGDLAYP
jgi:NAD(P)H-nitrite reductase large subunit